MIEDIKDVTRENLDKLSVAELKSIAKELKITGISTMKKADIIDQVSQKAAEISGALVPGPVVEESPAVAADTSVEAPPDAVAPVGKEDTGVPVATEAPAVKEPGEEEEKEKKRPVSRRTEAITEGMSISV